VHIETVRSSQESRNPRRDVGVSPWAFPSQKAKTRFQ